MEYIVVTSSFVKPRKKHAYRSKSLEEQVKKMLDEGWKLQGGVSVGYAGGGANVYDGRSRTPEGTFQWNVTYAQAMVKD